MATADLSKVLEHLRRALPPPEEADAGDGQLLARYVAGRDEAAFAALVRRHGRMVLGVCRRVLGHVQDSEDAFQAVFLVLARKAGSVVKRESLGSWLYGTAFRTALEARALQARRRAREKQVEELPHPAITPADPPDWRPLFDEELNRLPEKYRTAVVLCELEGRPRKEAARLLGLAEGTLSSRLAAARRLLAGRLAGRGLALSGGALAAAWAAESAAAAVPAALVTSTVRSALPSAAGQAAAATPAAALTQGVLQSMFLSKLKVAVAALLVVAALGAGALAYHGAGGPSQAQAADAPRPDSDLEALRKENELLRRSLELALEKIKAQDAEMRKLRERADQAEAMNHLFGNPLPYYPTHPSTGLPYFHSSAGPFSIHPYPLGPQPFTTFSAQPWPSSINPFPGFSTYPYSSSAYPYSSFPFGPSVKSKGAEPTERKPAEAEPKSADVPLSAVINIPGLAEAEEAVKALRAAKNGATLIKAIQDLEKAVTKLKKNQR
jgi:RNA polymerase sigma factor (sigma-70 family)